VQQPGKRYVGGLFAELVAERFVGFEPRLVLLDIRLIPAEAAATTFAGVCEGPAEHPPSERAPRDQAEAVVAKGGDDLELDRAVGQVVEALLADQAHEVLLACELLGGRDVPAGEVAAADVEHLALADELFHRLPDLFPRRRPVDVVHLVEVDVVGLQPAQAVLAGLADVVGGEVPVVRAGAHRLVDLGRENDPLPAPALGEPAADDLLRGAEALLHVRGLRAAVDVGGVEEVDALFERLVHDREAGRLVGDPAEVHRPEREPADLQARASEVRVLHRMLVVRAHGRSSTLIARRSSIAA
jgi:hypothetical protein